MDDLERRFFELEQKMTRKRSLFTDSRFHELDTKESGQLENEIYRMKELLELAGKPQGEWVSKKKSELLNRLENLIQKLGRTQQQLYGDRPSDASPLLDSDRGALGNDINRIDREMQDVRALLRLL
jgi:hypothetical protein